MGIESAVVKKGIGAADRPATMTLASTHDPQEHGEASGRYLGPAVYGGLDGIITTFAVVSGVVGGGLSADTILILGAANLFADGFAMATGAYLSAKSDREFYQREWHHQRRRIEHAPEQERSRLAALYRAADYSPEDASRLVEIQTRERRRWVNALMITQAGMLPEGTNPLMKGLVTFIAFVVAGTVPLLVHLVGLVMTIPSAALFPLTVILSALALFGLGTAKVWITERSAWQSGLEMLAIGGLAATVAYLVGALLGGLTGVSA